MAISIFDTHKFVRRLEAAGLTLEQAEAQAEVLTEAFTVNLEALVTKDYFESRLDVRFSEQQARIDKRFADQNAYMDKRFAEQKADIDTRLAEQKADLDTSLAEQRADMNARFAEQDAKIDSNHRVFVWTQAVVMAAVILPYIERLMSL